MKNNTELINILYANKLTISNCKYYYLPNTGCLTIGDMKVYFLGLMTCPLVNMNFRHMHFY